MPLEVVDVESMQRYELLEDGELLGYLSYDERHERPSQTEDGASDSDGGVATCTGNTGNTGNTGDTGDGRDRDGGEADVEPILIRDLQHTLIDPDQRGRGLASVLVPAVLDDIRARGAKLMPTCPFVRGWIDEHPEQQDLVL